MHGEVLCNQLLGKKSQSSFYGWLGVVTAIAGLVGIFRNMSGVVAPVAEINNYLLPTYMIILGVALARWRDTAVATPT